MRRPWLSAILPTCLALALFVASYAPELTLRSDWRTAQADLSGEGIPWGPGASGGAFSPTPGGALALIWRALDFGNLNILSSILMALATGTVVLVAQRAGAGRVAVLSGCGFALSPHVWSLAIAAEADLGPPLHVLLVGLALVCLADAERSRRAVWLASMTIALAAIDDASMGVFLLLLFVGTPWTDMRSFTGAGQLQQIPPRDSHRPGDTVRHRLVAQRAGAEGPWRWHAGAAGLALVVAAHLALAAINGSGEELHRSGPIAASFGGVGQHATGLARQLVDDVGPLTVVLGLLGLVRGPGWLRVATVVAWLVAIAGPVPGEFTSAARLSLVLAIWWPAVGASLAVLRRWPVRQAGLASAALAVVLLLVQAITLHTRAPARVNRDTGSALAGVLQRLPDRGVVVSDQSRVIRVLRWGLLRGDVRGREVITADADRIGKAHQDGRTVLVSEGAWRRVSLMGVDGLSEPVPGRPVGDWLADLPRDAVVAGAATAEGTSGGDIDGYFARIGLPHVGLSDGVTFVAQPRHRRIIVSAAGARVVAASPSEPGGLLGPYLPEAGVGAFRDDEGGIGVVLNGQEVAYGEAGVVLAFWDAATGEWSADAFPSRRGLRTTWRVPGLGFFRVTDRSACVEVAATPVSIRERANAARIGLMIPGGATATVELSEASPAEIRVRGFEDRLPPAWEVTNRSNGSPADPSRVVVHNPDRRPSLVAVSWSGLPTAVNAWANAPTRVCAGPGGTRVLPRVDSLRVSTLNLNDTEAFRSGWSPPSRVGGQRLRHIQGEEAHVMLHAEVRGPVEIILTPHPDSTPMTEPPFTLQVDGVTLEADLSEDSSSIRWRVPRQLWPVGVRRLVFRARADAAPAAARSLPPIVGLRVRRLAPAESS